MKPYYSEKGIQIFQADCLEAMRLIPDASIDACITDPPYGTTACSWDSVIPFAPMWAELKRIVKKNGAIVLFGSQPFTSALVMSNAQMFRYQWVWDKKRSANGALADKMPMRAHEDILIFSACPPRYFPQMQAWPDDEVKRMRKCAAVTHAHSFMGLKTFVSIGRDAKVVNGKHPSSLLRIPAIGSIDSERTGHPTQKPVDLVRYLVRTYTNEGDTVLDFTCGSGTTGVACVIEKRSAVLIEQDAHYCEVSAARIKRAQGVACDIPKRVKQYAPTPLFEAVA